LADVAPRLLSTAIALGSLAHFGVLAQIAPATPSAAASDVAKPTPADLGRTTPKDATSAVTLKAVVVRAATRLKHAGSPPPQKSLLDATISSFMETRRSVNCSNVFQASQCKVVLAEVVLRACVVWVMDTPKF